MADFALIRAGARRRGPGARRLRRAARPARSRSARSARRRGSPIPISQPLDPPSAFLVEAAAQGLVRFDAGGEIEPALAQSWIVSDDGLRYTFRLGATNWPDGSRSPPSRSPPGCAPRSSRASRNPLKPVLGAIDEIVRDDRRCARDQPARPAAQFPAVARPAGDGDRPERSRHRPYRLAGGEAGRRGPARSRADEDEESRPTAPPDMLLRGEPAATGRRPLRRAARPISSLGGTLGDLPFARAAGAARQRGCASIR